MKAGLVGPTFDARLVGPSTFIEGWTSRYLFKAGLADRHPLLKAGLVGPITFIEGWTSQSLLKAGLVNIY